MGPGGFCPPLFCVQECCCFNVTPIGKIEMRPQPSARMLPRQKQMSINQRQHVRFSLDIPATLITKYGERQETLLQQISIGGCFTGWEENLYTGDEFRLEIELPNKNRLPLKCKAIYRFEDTGIGVRFTDISEFEQRLISSIVEDRLEREGLSMDVDAFKQPAKFIKDDDSPRITDHRRERDELLEKIMSGKEIS